VWPGLTQEAAQTGLQRWIDHLGERREPHEKVCFGIGLLLFSAMLSVQAYAAGSSHAEYVKKYGGDRQLHYRHLS